MDRRMETGSVDDHSNKAVSALADSGYGGTQSKSSAENSSNSAADVCSRSGTGSSGSEHLGTACSSGEGTSKETSSSTSGSSVVKADHHDEANKTNEDFDLTGGACELANAAQLAIRCLKKLTCQDALDFDTKVSKDSSASHLAPGAHLEDLPNKIIEGGCTLLISLQSMCVIQASPGTKETLGFSEQMLCSKSFLDFVYPRDRFTFTSEVTSMMRAFGEGKPVSDTCVFYIRMRGSKALEMAGFDIKSKRTVYKPYRGNMQIKVVRSSKDKERPLTPREPEYYAVVKLVPIRSAYEEAYDREEVAAGSFGTRHTSSCHLSHVDAAAIPYLGYLPQDLIGNSIFDYYHPEDLDFLKKDFESVLQRAGATCAGARSRFRAHNGCYLVLNTDWSCFVNPWTYRSEFVIGQHRVVESPSNSDVFLIPKETDIPVAEKIRQESVGLQEEIRDLLSKSLPVDQKRTGERSLMRKPAKLHGEVTSQLEGSKLADNSGPEFINSSSQQESVLMGHVSPLHEEQEGSRSNTSGSSVTTYNQLNYRESIMRFFQSQQKNASSDELSTAGRGPKIIPFSSPILSTTDDDVNNMDSVSNVHSKTNSNESSSNHQSHVTSSNEVVEMGTSVSKNTMKRTMQKAQQQSSDHSGQTPCEHCMKEGIAPGSCQVCTSSSGGGGSSSANNNANGAEASTGDSQRKRNHEGAHHYRSHAHHHRRSHQQQQQQEGSIAARVGCIERHLLASGSNFIPENRAEGGVASGTCGRGRKLRCSHEPRPQQTQGGSLTEELLRKHTKMESKIFVKQHRPVKAKQAGPSGSRPVAPVMPSHNLKPVKVGGARGHALGAVDSNAVKLISAAAVAASGAVSTFGDIAGMDVLIDRVAEAFLRRQYEQQARSGPISGAEPRNVSQSQPVRQGQQVQVAAAARPGGANLMPARGLHLGGSAAGNRRATQVAQWSQHMERGLKRSAPHQASVRFPGSGLANPHKRPCQGSAAGAPGFKSHGPVGDEGMDAGYGAMLSKNLGGHIPRNVPVELANRPFAMHGQGHASSSTALAAQRRPLPPLLPHGGQSPLAFGRQTMPAPVPMDEDTSGSTPYSSEKQSCGCSLEEEKTAAAPPRHHHGHAPPHRVAVAVAHGSPTREVRGRDPVSNPASRYGSHHHHHHHHSQQTSAGHLGNSREPHRGSNLATNSRPRFGDPMTLPSTSFRSDHLVKPVNRQTNDGQRGDQNRSSSDDSGGQESMQEGNQSRSNNGNQQSAKDSSNDDSFSFSLSDGSGSGSRGFSSSTAGADSSTSATRPKRTNLPPWMDGVDFDENVAYTYTMPATHMGDILASDRAALESMQQPMLVETQLSQLYRDMHSDDVSSLGYDEGADSSTSNEAGDGPGNGEQAAVAAGAVASDEASGSGSNSGSGDASNSSYARQGSSQQSSSGSSGRNSFKRAEARRRKKAIFMEGDGHIPHPESPREDTGDASMPM